MNLRKRAVAGLALGGLLAALAGGPALAQAGAGAATPRDGRRDFDFEIGSWRTDLKRLKHPLSGSTEWVSYRGTSVVRKVWGGAANLLELKVHGAAGDIEALSLRLYDPDRRQWSLNFASRAGGQVAGPPTVGGFKDGRGEFYDHEMLGDRPILVRFVISGVTATSAHFEQAFSADDGKTWEVNWIATDTRIDARR
ncbi:MAG: hypothetical protein JWP49_2763 [Phenylobacterium sp.]|jgi:hypothetical protein|nr:hypothetical protein [Phenylobacterium sp.]